MKYSPAIPIKYFSCANLRLQVSRFLSKNMDPSKKPVPEGMSVVKEGQAVCLFPGKNEVFYNPVQEFNRDISICAINAFEEMFYQEQLAKAEKKLVNRKKRENNENLEAEEVVRGLSILEGLSATGLRSVRYAKEVTHVKRIVSNDFDAEAVELIHKNIEFNNIDPKLMTPNCDDCMMVCLQNREFGKRFDIVDLDPYGTPAPFIESAVQCVEEGGLLIVTATDMRVLCGDMLENGFSKYGSMPLRCPQAKDNALRILLSTIERKACCQKRHIVPILSICGEFYIRVFVRVYSSKTNVKDTASKQSNIFMCFGCHSWHLQPLGHVEKLAKSKKHTPGSGPTAPQRCEHCESRFRMGGPIWNKAIHDVSFVDKMLTQLKKDGKEKFGTCERIIGTLNVIREELPSPMSLNLPTMAKLLKTEVPKNKIFRSAFLNAGYLVSGSHCNPEAIKTNAPFDFVWDVWRAAIKQKPSKYPPNTQAGLKILEKEITHDIDFKVHSQAIPESMKLDLTRFPMNPEKNWGPKARAGKRTAEEEEERETKTDGTNDKNNDTNNSIVPEAKQIKVDENE